MDADKREKTQRRRLDQIIWIHTPRCRECVEYSAVLKGCRLEICKYPSKR